MTQEQMREIWNGKLRHTANINIWHSFRECDPGVNHALGEDLELRIELDDMARKLNDLEILLGDVESKLGASEHDLEDATSKIEEYDDLRCHILRLVEKKL